MNRAREGEDVGEEDDEGRGEQGVRGTTLGGKQNDDTNKGARLAGDEAERPAICEPRKAATFVCAL